MTPFRYAILLIILGAISLASVWTNSNSWLSTIFGFGGFISIILGLTLLGRVADADLQKDLQKAYDPNLVYSEKRLSYLSFFSGSMMIFLFFVLRISQFWFCSLVNKLWFVISIGASSILLAFILVHFLYHRIPELQAATEKSISSVVCFFIGFACLGFFIFFGIQFISAQKQAPLKRPYLLHEKIYPHSKTESLIIEINESKRTFGSSIEDWIRLETGDSIMVDVHRGILGFEHFFKFQPVKEKEQFIIDQ